MEVVVNGSACAVPILAIFAQIAAYNRLTERGSTTWDVRNRIVVRQEVLDMGRILGICAIVLVLIFVRMGRGER